MKNLPNKMSSVQFRSGRHTYFFNVKDNARGDKYLKISESVIDNFEKHKITILSQDLPAFQKAFDSICKQNSSKNVEKCSIVKNKKNHKRWTPKEVDYLMLLQKKDSMPNQFRWKWGKKLAVFV
ncbi:MAG: hypothetical protein ACI9XO_000348 [Paraglaciecola sp.]|jgi:hypothetical protein